MPSNMWEIPKFDTLEEERIYRKEHLVAGCRLFGEFGYDEGIAGHISARDPIKTDHFWVNPYGVHFSDVTVESLVLVNTQGEVVEGIHNVNRAAFVIHSAIHQLRPEIVAAAHSHSMYGKAFSSLGVFLDPISQDSCAFYKDHAIYTDYNGVALNEEEGKQIAFALGENKACILQNHGLLTVGKTVDEALWWFISLERACKAQMLADSCGKPLRIPNDIAELTYTQVGSSQAGWFNFQPMYKWIAKKYPDMF